MPILTCKLCHYPYWYESWSEKGWKDKDFCPNCANGIQQGMNPNQIRRCENERCNRELPFGWNAVYCSNQCALEDS